MTKKLRGKALLEFEQQLQQNKSNVKYLFIGLAIGSVILYFIYISIT